VFELQTSIRAFVNKLAIFVTRAKTGDFGLFPHHKEFLATTDSEMSFPSVKQDLVQYLTNLQVNLKERFPELEEVSHRHVQFPFRVDAEACGDLALEVAELQSSENQKVQFEDSDLASFWLNAPKRYACLKNEATKALVKFGSTYVCEATFSCMVYIKSMYRNQLTDAHLQDNLIIATTVELV